MRTTKSSFPLTATRATDPLGGSRTRVHETVEGDPQGFYRVAEPILRAIVERSVRRDSRRLKELLESRRPAPHRHPPPGPAPATPSPPGRG